MIDAIEVDDNYAKVKLTIRSTGGSIIEAELAVPKIFQATAYESIKLTGITFGFWTLVYNYPDLTICYANEGIKYTIRLSHEQTSELMVVLKTIAASNKYEARANKFRSANTE